MRKSGGFFARANSSVVNLGIGWEDGPAIAVPPSTVRSPALPPLDNRTINNRAGGGDVTQFPQSFSVVANVQGKKRGTKRPRKSGSDDSLSRRSPLDAKKIVKQSSSSSSSSSEDEDDEDDCQTEEIGESGATSEVSGSDALFGSPSKSGSESEPPYVLCQDEPGVKRNNKRKRQRTSESEGSSTVGGGGGGEISSGAKGKACFGCEFAWHVHSGGVSRGPVVECFRLLEQNYGQIEDKALARLAREFFLAEVYRPARERGKPLPDWPLKTILEHIQRHTHDPRPFLMNAIKDLEEKRNAMACFLFSLDETGRKHWDKDAMREYRELLKLQLQLYSKPPQTMNFFNANQDIDFQRLGGFAKSFSLG